LVVEAACNIFVVAVAAGILDQSCVASLSSMVPRVALDVDRRVRVEDATVEP
jgi:hypothetical protein